MIQEKKPHSSRMEMKMQIVITLLRWRLKLRCYHNFDVTEDIRTLLAKEELNTNQGEICSYSKEPILVIGCFYVNLVCKGQTAIDMPSLIGQGSGLCLFGRNWLKEMILDWNEIHHVYSDSLQVILDMYSAVFQEGLRSLKGFQAKIHTC